MTEPARAAPLEIEAKLLVPRAADLGAIARLEQLGAYRLRPLGTARLYSLYLDTAERTLVRHGVALRVRRHGRRWEATAKWPGQVNGTVHERPELTVPLSGAPAMPFALPEGALGLQLSALVAGRPLVPILITHVQRRRFHLLPSLPSEVVDELEEPVAELALDRVRLVAPQGGHGAVATYCEAEIELLHGARRDVAELAQLLQDQFGLTASSDSKFARGLMLLYGPALLGSREPGLPGTTDTVEAAACKVVAVHLRRLRQHDPGARLGEDPEALHDMRVAVRRLRAAVRIFEAGIPARSRDHLAGELQWLGHALGGVRDLDVQLERLTRPDPNRGAAGAGPGAALADLEEYLQAERAQRRTAMLAVLSSSRYFRLLVRLERFTLQSPRRPRTAGRELVVVAGRRALQHAVTRLLRRGDNIAASGATPTVEDLHALRIRAKRLRYLLEFLCELTGKPGRRFVKRLVRLQDLLGAHQDAVVATDWTRRYAESRGAQSDSETLLALGMLIGHEQRIAAEARADFHKTWRRFARKGAPKELHELLRRLRAEDAPPSPEAPEAVEEAR